MTSKLIFHLRYIGHIRRNLFVSLNEWSNPYLSPACNRHRMLRDLIPPCNRFLLIYNSYSTDALLSPCGSSIPVCSSPQSFATTREMPSNQIENTIRYITTPHRPYHPSDNLIRLNDSSHTVCLLTTWNKANKFFLFHWLFLFVQSVTIEENYVWFILLYVFVKVWTKWPCPSCLELLPRDTGKYV